MAEDLRSHGYLRAMGFVPPLALADPLANADAMMESLEVARERHVSLVLFPELAVTGFTCEDLFFSRALRDDARQALGRLAEATRGHAPTVVVGAPWASGDGRLFNCAFVLADGVVAGAVPKIHLPNYGEFYGRRWFTSGASVSLLAEDPLLGAFPVDARQLFVVGGQRFAIEICEDLWAPDPPGARHAVAGASLILNPSASNELVAKADYRRDLVRMSSAQRICGYLYASSGPLESTKDVVFGGHMLAAENGGMLGEGERFRFGGAALLADFDCEKIEHDRLQHTTFRTAERPEPYPLRSAGAGLPLPELEREYPAHPFVPDDEAEFDARAAEILSIQAAGLARRMQGAGSARLLIGLSGGLDSTLALLVALDALELRGLGRDHLHAITMPGPGTSEHTLESARALARAAGVDLREVPIDAAVAQHLGDLGHDADVHDVVYENAQARERTQLLFNLANKLGGIVVGTGDLSELALGWCTYNADHMSSYNVNVSVPKTMVAYLVRWYARHRASQGLAGVLHRVLDTPISPELVPDANDTGEVAQRTEEIIGPYVLHDFFLYGYVRCGFSPAKLRLLAARSFAGRYGEGEIDRWLETFLQRFHSQQFKRTVLPAGPKVGTVSLSPRGDWRMPDESVPPR